LTKGSIVRHFTTHDALLWPDGVGVTIGIGVICERGDCIVIGSDMRASYGTEPEIIGPNDQCGKVFRLAPFPTIACVAGRMSECHAVVSQICNSVRKLRQRRDIGREHVMNIIDEARKRELRLIYSWTLTTKLGISLHDWVRGEVPGGKLDKLILRAGVNFLKDAPLRVELIVGGFMRRRTMFFRAVQKNRLEEESSPGVYVIGTGQRHAMRVLNRRGQHFGMSLSRTLLHVHEAMIAARKEQTVGPATSYIVMRKHVPELLYLPTTSPTLDSWKRAYRERPNTASLDDSRVAGMQIYQQLRYLKISKKDTVAR